MSTTPSGTTPTAEDVPARTPTIHPGSADPDAPIPDATPVLPGPNSAPSKAQFLAAIAPATAQGQRPPISDSLHTSTYSVVSTDTSDAASDASDERAPPRAPAPGSGPASPGFHGRMRRHIYGLSVDGGGSPEGSTLALPYGTSRNNSVETFATYNSDDARAQRDAYDSDQSMLEDKR